MLTKIKNRLIGKSNSSLLKVKCDELYEQRKVSSELVIYGTSTQGNWLGIANATKILFSKTAYSFPQEFSKNAFTKKEFEKWKKHLLELEFKKITFSGFAYFFYNLIEEIGHKTHVEIIYHGTISEFYETEKQKWISKMILLGKEQKIKGFGFVKKGLAETVHQLYGFNCFHTPLPTPKVPKIKKLCLDREKIHIGVFGSDTFNKNLHNQVIHALLIENTVIHVLDKAIFYYLNMDERIIEHGKNLTHDRFLQVLGSMDLNLYMSYSESWGLVAYESEALGVPCINSFQVNYLEIINEQVKNIRK